MIGKFLHRLFVAIGLVATIGTLAAIADYAIKDGAGASQTVFAFVCFATKICPASVPINSAGTEIGTTAAPLNTQITSGGNTVAVKAASTAPLATDPAAVVVLRSDSAGLIATGTNPSPSAVFISTTGGLLQGSTSSGQTGNLILAAVTTGAPSYTTAQSNPLSLDTAGNLRATLLSAGPVAHGTAATKSNLVGAVYTAAGVTVGDTEQVALQVNASGALITTNPASDPCRNVSPVIKPLSITTAASTSLVAGVSNKKTYVCYLYMQTAAAGKVAVVEATTGTSCVTVTAALVGGTSAANGLNNAANSGQAFGNGGYSVLQTATNNDDICLITDTSTPLAVVVKYVQQ